MTSPTNARDRFLAFRRRLYGDHDLSAVDEYLHPQFSSHSAMIPGVGREVYKQFVERLYQGVPDLRPEEQHILVEGDQLMAMTSWRGTHTGTFLGVPATGTNITFATADRYQLVDQLLFRHWDVVDRLDASIAIGLLASKPRPAA